MDFFKNINELNYDFPLELSSLKYNNDNREVGLCIGTPVWQWTFDQIPEQHITDNALLQQSIKWFKYLGPDLENREIVFRCRIRVIGSAQTPWPFEGSLTLFDNAWDLEAGINLEVENNQLSTRLRIREINSDWPSGVGGMFISAFDAVGGSLSWLMNNEFTRISDMLARMAGQMVNLSDAAKLSHLLGSLNNLMNKQVLTMSRTAYDDKGLWIWFKPNDVRFREVKDNMVGIFKNIIKESGNLLK